MKKGFFLFFITLLLVSCSQSEYDDVSIIDSKNNQRVLLSAFKVDKSNLKGVSLDSKRWETGQVIKIKFLDGSSILQEKVKEIGAKWLEHANLEFEYVTSGKADVRIQFARNYTDTERIVNWSYIGTDSKFTPPTMIDLPSMNLYLFEDETEEDYFQAIVLQQYGLMLGLEYEHKNPDADISWNYSKLRREFIKAGWELDYIDEFIAQLSAMEVAATEFDSESVMVYSDFGSLSSGGYGATPNTELSEKDKAFISEIYPGVKPDDYESLPKNKRTVYHRVMCMGYFGEYISTGHALNPYNYDNWLPDELDNDDLPNGNYEYTWVAPHRHAEGTYKVIDCDEISIFTQSMRVHTSRNPTVNFGYLADLDVRQSDLDGPYFFGERKCNLQEFDQLYGGYYPWGNNTVIAFFHPNLNNIYKDNTKAEDISEGWGVISSGEILQLIGQAPRKHNDFWKDIKDFFFASAEDDYITNGSRPLLNCANISGLTFTPGGIVQNIEAANAFNRQGVKVQNFGQMMTLATTKYKWERQAYLTTFNEDGNSIPHGVRLSYWLAWGGNVRFSRVKTAAELGYRLVADLEEDAVKFEDPTWTNTDTSRYIELITNSVASTPDEQETSIQRGVALRYANRAKRVVTKSWSEIKAEAAELRAYVK